jgi:hypothetical protein
VAFLPRVILRPQEVRAITLGERSVAEPLQLVETGEVSSVLED